MDLIESDHRRRPRLPALAVGVALVLVGAGQAAAVLRTPPLDDDVRLTVPKEAFGFTTAGRDVTVSFQLRNTGERSIRVTGVGRALPGLELVDVVASGSPVQFRSVGTGDGPLPAFALPPGDAALLSLTYRLTGCNDVPRDLRPVPIAVRDGRSRGVRPVALPQLPDDAAEATDADVVEWQQVLVRELCA